MLLKPANSPDQGFAAFPASKMTVISGANDGDSLSASDDLVLDDIYSLTDAPQLHQLTLRCNDRGQYHVSPASAVGQIGSEVRFDCVVTLMSHDAPLTEIVVALHLGKCGSADRIFALPLGPLKAEVSYRLIGVDRQAAALRLAQASCGSLARGTAITTGSGEQKRVEDLKIGERILTRDHGVQHLRWVGHSTQRAFGDFAPVRILAGALNNAYDLMVSPNQRFVIAGRAVQSGVTRSETQVKAADLVNGHSINTMPGGFVDYYQLLFDTHQVIYAHGTATECLPIDGHTAALVPPVILSRSGVAAARDNLAPANGIALSDQALPGADIVDVLRHATMR